LGNLRIMCEPKHQDSASRQDNDMLLQVSHVIWATSTSRVGCGTRKQGPHTSIAKRARLGMEPPYESVRLLELDFRNWSIRYPLAAWISTPWNPAHSHSQLLASPMACMPFDFHLQHVSADTSILSNTKKRICCVACE
jgi:hypothetical protein